jgi:hypothetical protein
MLKPDENGWLLTLSLSWQGCYQNNYDRSNSFPAYNLKHLNIQHIIRSSKKPFYDLKANWAPLALRKLGAEIDKECE